MRFARPAGCPAPRYLAVGWSEASMDAFRFATTRATDDQRSYPGASMRTIREPIATASSTMGVEPTT